MDRDGTVMKLPSRAGTSYFSYGQIHYKPSAMKLYGRIHVDVNTSFAYSEAGFEGLFELSRICRMPLHTASRASIGKALSSLQFYHASKIGLLVPWKPTLVESFKDRNELLMADRGGFIFEPKIGVHEGVGELDFHALYPNIMLRKNISAETVHCPCCPDSKNRVPELNWNVCERQTGIVPRSIEIVVKKRIGYKERKEIARRTGNETDYAKYNERQAVLKWIGVTCLPRESPVFIRSDGTDRFVRIGDFIDSVVGDRVGVMDCPPGVFVAGVGRDYKAKHCKVACLIKIPNDQKLLSLTMEDGRQIVATPDHQFFTLRDGSLKAKRADELRMGELIPIAKKIPPSVNEILELDLIQRLRGLLTRKEQHLWKVSGEQLREAIKAKQQILIKEAASEGYTYQAVISWIKSGIIPLKFFSLLDVASEVHTSLKIGSGRRKGGRVAWLPAVLPVNEELGFFLGLYVADGSATRNYTRLDIGEIEPDLLESARRIIAELFGVAPHVYKERKARMFVQVNSASLVKVLDKIFGLPGSAELGKLKVPEIVFNSSEGTARGFIEGMVAGGGFASKTLQFVNIGTTSKELLNQLAFLSARLGLTFRIGDLHTNTNTINFVGPETRRILSWKLLKRAHQDLVFSYTRAYDTRCSHPTYGKLPALESGLYELARATRNSCKPPVKPTSLMRPITVEKRIAAIRVQNLNQRQALMIDKIDGLINSDLGFVRIKEILQTDSNPDYVYCFQLAEDEAPCFFTGQGVILTRNCFGYLGFNNAKFGRIDAHIAVCAWDRKILIDTARIAERRGFEVMHGIVDSLWLQKAGTCRGDYLELKAEIEKETGFAMSFEGIYKWVAFLPSKVEPNIPVLNRYFGVYDTGELKVRGIEARRHDTPLAFAKCQMEILRVLAKGDTVAEAKAKIPECVDIFLGHAEALARHEVLSSELAFTTNLSKAPEEYTTMTVQHAALNQLTGEGASLHAGEGVRYIIADYKGKGSKRATPLDLVKDETKYDAGRYIRLLAETCASVLEPFDAGRTATGLLTSYEARRSGNLV